MSHPHDAAFKRIFGRPELAADLMRRRLPAALLERLDLDRCEPMTGEYVDRALRNRRPDLVFRVPFADDSGRVAFVFVLIEHQSTPDPLMAFRALAYIVGTLERFIEQHRAEHGAAPRTLPAVIPLVVHQGKRPWAAARSLAETFDLPSDLQAVLGEHLPRLTLLIDDLAVPDGERAGKTRLALTAVALLTLRYVRREVDPDGFVERWAGLIAASIGEPGREAIIEAVGAYVYTQSEHLPPERLIEAIEAADVRTQEALMTIADKLRAQGRAEGEARGEARGLAAGRAETVLALIRARLGEPSPALTARINTEAGAQTARWLERILAASSLAELEDDPSS